jgi:hypothetical protein
LIVFVQRVVCRNPALPTTTVVLVGLEAAEVTPMVDANGVEYLAMIVDEVMFHHALAVAGLTPQALEVSPLGELQPTARQETSARIS